MIVGNGLLAKTFDFYKNNDFILIFASGVSNSNETNKEMFIREKNLLENTIKHNSNKTIVYFSSCDVIYAEKINLQYYYHKLKMEEIIKKMALKYYIFRLPQVIGFSKNNNSLINYFINSIIENKKILVWKYAYKNLINIKDVLNIAQNIIKSDKYINKIINVINENYYSILEIIDTIEEVINKKPRISLVDKGIKPNYSIDFTEEFNIDFTEDYLKKSIIQHYQKIV